MGPALLFSQLADQDCPRSNRHRLEKKKVSQSVDVAHGSAPHLDHQMRRNHLPAFTSSPLKKNYGPPFN